MSPRLPWPPLLALATSLALACTPEEEPADGGGDDPPFDSQDTDNDGILDSIEGQGDSDLDGTPDYLDTDSDGDCIPDEIEKGTVTIVALPFDSDMDGTADYLDLDSDDNSLPDRDEAVSCTAPVDLDGDEDGDWRDQDDDDDSMRDLDDGFLDVDLDTLPAYQDEDSDGDCIPDYVEAGDDDPDTLPVDSDADTLADFQDLDSDQDGLTDMEEAAGRCIDVLDTDNDLNPDYIDDDIDGDGLSNLEELVIGTDGWERDTDEDGFTDGLEEFAGTQPLESASVPFGTVIETGPRQISEHEGDYNLDDYILDIFVLLDTSYSYSCYHPNLEQFIEELVDALFAEFEDVAVGFGTYDDYRWAKGWASSTGSPYHMEHQISTNHTSVKAAAQGMQMVYGGDAPGSAYEALFQTASGHGYDQTCDVVLEDLVDIEPFIAAEDDAFDGAVAGTFNERVDGSGARGGVGFRSGSSPIIVLTADNVMRDADLGHPMPTDTCDDPGTLEMAVAEIADLHARVLGINVYEYQSTDDALHSQFNDIAAATGSYIDSDDDGFKDDPAVLFGSWNWPSLDLVIDALWDMAQEMDMDISFVVAEDENGWITSFNPDEDEVFTIERGDSVTYTFELSTSAPTLPDDQFYHARVDIMDDDDVVDEEDIWVVIRPETVN